MRRSTLSRLQPVAFWVWALAAVTVIALVSLVVIYLAGRDSDAGPTNEVAPVTSTAPSPAAAADEFLSAWSSSDWPTVGRLVDDAGVATELLIDWARRLEVVSVGFTTGQPQVQDDSATVPMHTTVEVAGAGTWEYNSTLYLARSGGGWGVVWRPDTLHPSLSDGDRLELETVWATRGLITDKDGRALVEPVSGVAVGLIPERITSRAAVAAAFEETLAVPRSTIDGILDQPGIQPDWFLPVATISREANVSVKPVLFPVPGIAFRIVDRRNSVTTLATPVLGTTGEITAEQLAALGEPYTANTIVGQSGLEKAFERQLAGSPIGRVIKRAADGSSEVLFSFDTTPPEDLRTTLSFDVQIAAETVLANVDLPASIVAVDAASGEVRAVAGTPADGFSRPTSGLYPPGSTFKIIVATALLEAGLEPADPVSCPDVINVAGKEFGNAVRLPATMSFEDAFARSCNTAFIELAAGLDPDSLAEAAARFGFGSRIDIGIPAADAAFEPSTDAVESASAAIGQGEVLASPLNMASVAGAAATGIWRPPTLVAGARETDGDPLDESVLASLQQMMRAVVTAGSGQAAAVAGSDVAGKTGTAQVVTADGPSTVAWFVGFADGLAFAVNVEGGESGGTTAGPLAAAFLEQVAAQQLANAPKECVDAGADWVTFQGDMTRSGCSRAEAILQPRRLWQADVGISGWLNSPIVVGETVVVGSAGTRRSGSDDGDGVYALDLRSGRQSWYFKTANDVNGVAALGDLVVATGDEGSVWGIDLTTGRQQWSFTAGAPVFTNPLIVEDTIVVGDASGVLWALNLDGTERWHVELDGAIRGGAASDGSMIFAVSEHGDAAGLTLDGFQMWRTRVTTAAAAGQATPDPATVFAAPTVVGDKLILSLMVDGGPTEPAVIALDRFLGTVLWHASDPDRRVDGYGNVRGSAARSGETLVVAASLSRGVEAMDAGTGQVMWATTDGAQCERQWASPIVMSRLILLPRPDGALHGYDAASGELMWRLAPASPSEVATLAQCETEGQQLQDGFDLQASVAIAPDGTIIVASTSQLMYAIGGS